LDKSTITINGNSPTINFNYNGSTKVTSSIVESAAKELTITALTKITEGSYFGN
jgi:hypothetical protein